MVIIVNQNSNSLCIFTIWPGWVFVRHLSHLALTRSMSRPSADTCAFGAPHMFCVYSSKWAMPTSPIASQSSMSRRSQSRFARCHGIRRMCVQARPLGSLLVHIQPHRHCFVCKQACTKHDSRLCMAHFTRKKSALDEKAKALTYMTKQPIWNLRLR